MIVLIYLLISVSCLSDSDLNILSLNKDSFPNIFKSHQHLIIMFYQPWCGLSRRFAPVFKQIVYETQYKYPEIQFAKLDATSENSISDVYNITKYPALKLFIDGYPITYKKQKSKEDIIKWIDKKLVSAVFPIASEKELDRLFLKSHQSVVIFGSDPGKNLLFKMLALDDDNNIYYNATSIRSSTTPVVELYRNFDGGVVIRYTQDSFDSLEQWISVNSQPYIKTFNRDLLRKIFTDFVPAVVFFNTNRDKELHKNLSDFVKKEKIEGLIFTEIDPNHQLFTKFVHYLNIDVYYPQMVIIIAETKHKIMYTGKITIKEMTGEALRQFFQRYKRDQLERLAMTQHAGSDYNL